jgi:prevent-host-death family protein
MIEVTVTTFRKHLPDYLGKVRNGEDIALTSRGKVIARLVPPVDECRYAQTKLEACRLACRIGDVESPLDEAWGADRVDS